MSAQPNNKNCRFSNGESRQEWKDIGHSLQIAQHSSPLSPSCASNIDFAEHLQWGLCEYVIVHTNLGGSPVILWISLGGKPKWHPLKFGYHDVIRARKIFSVILAKVEENGKF